jgi:ubiquinone/menaquinone biosynthesis C-methylase UbiE
MAEQLEQVREAVRERYAQAAGTASCGTSCCGPPEHSVFGSGLYHPDDRGSLPDEAALASLGCGNPTAVAELHEGEVVLDLGSGGGIDVLLSAQRVGSTGKAYGLDMTDEMLELARENARKAGAQNVEFLKGVIEAIPLSDESVDVVISNCVINLSGDKAATLRETARVLRPGGRLAITDIVADEDMPDEVRRDMAQWTGCIAGALTPDEYRRHLAEAGLGEIEVSETHRVHENAGSAIVRARKPSP